MRDENNRLSSVDFVTPGGRFVIASDDNGDINPDAAALLPLIPIPYVTSQVAGWERGLLSPSKVRLAPRTGFAWSLNDDRAVLRGGYGIFLNQWAYSVQTAFSRNLPFFFTRQVDIPADQRVPAFQTRNILTSDPTGVVAPSIMDHAYTVEYTQTWSGGLQYQAAPVDDGGSVVHGIVDAWAPTMRPSTMCPSRDRDRFRRDARFRSWVPFGRFGSMGNRSTTA